MARIQLQEKLTYHSYYYRWADPTIDFLLLAVGGYCRRRNLTTIHLTVEIGRMNREIIIILSPARNSGVYGFNMVREDVIVAKTI